MKKLLALALSLCLLLAAMPVVSLAEDYREPITLTVFSEVANFAGEQSGWFAKEVKDRFNITLKFVSTNVDANAYAAGVSAGLTTLPAGETTKCLEQLSRLYDAFLDAHLTRADLVIALGGGVIGDITGYAACTYLRGVHFVQVPTTLLAQVDSSVGGKVAVNHPRGKNLLGAFYQPELVLIDCDTLRTLDARQVGAGLGEVIKYGCIADAALF